MSQLTSFGNENVRGTINDYNQQFKDGSMTGEDNKEKCEDFVRNYYDVATDFFEYGWGPSFHFAPQHTGETFREAIRRHEYYLAMKLNLKQGMNVLDTGCGIGGPAVNIARFSEANVVGLNINKYQISKGKALAASQNLSDRVSFLEGSFLDIPKEDNFYDAVYSIEATCHAADQVKCYSEIYRVLKPGAYFACYEWCLTDKFDFNNANHLKTKELIELGDGLPDIRTTQQTVDNLNKIGYNVIEYCDRTQVTERNDVPWYRTLDHGTFSMKEFKTTKVGIKTTQIMCNAMEAFRIAPKGTGKVHKTLCNAITGLVRGGRDDIFTPAFFFLVQKPAE